MYYGYDRLVKLLAFTFSLNLSCHLQHEGRNKAFSSSISVTKIMSMKAGEPKPS